MNNRTIAAIAIAGVVAGGCAAYQPNVAPGPKLAEPPKWAMQTSAGPGAIPENDGDPAVRRDFLALERTHHAQCVDRHTALRRYIVKVRE